MTRSDATKLVKFLNTAKIFPEETANDIPFSILQYERPDEEFLGSMPDEPRLLEESRTFGLTWNPYEFCWEILAMTAAQPLPTTDELTERKKELAL
jgi:hypothetical protein